MYAVKKLLYFCRYMTRKISFYIIALVVAASWGFRAEKKSHQLFTAKGEKATYEQMLKEMNNADIILFGELHNDPIGHWLQRELTADLAQKHGKNLIIGAEMFEADNQLILDEYLNGTIKEAKFEEEARIWNNYKTDYRPLVNIAKANNLPFIATNVPRRYASLVFARGLEALDSLSPEAKQYMVPLPFTYDPNVSCYKKMLEMNMGGHSSENLPKAQALKDATMAHFLLKNYTKGKVFIHYHGAYHSENYEGIMWYLRQQNKDLRIKTITCVEQELLEKLDTANTGKADFVIAVDKDMTKTH